MVSKRKKHDLELLHRGEDAKCRACQFGKRSFRKISWQRAGYEVWAWMTGHPDHVAILDGREISWESPDVEPLSCNSHVQVRGGILREGGTVHASFFELFVETLGGCFDRSLIPTSQPGPGGIEVRRPWTRDNSCLIVSRRSDAKIPKGMRGSRLASVKLVAKKAVVHVSVVTTDDMEDAPMNFKKVLRFSDELSDEVALEIAHAAFKHDEDVREAAKRIKSCFKKLRAMRKKEALTNVGRRFGCRSA